MTSFYYVGKKDNVNVSVLKVGNAAYAAGEAGSTWKFNPDTLASDCCFRMIEKFMMPMVTAHPHYGL